MNSSHSLQFLRPQVFSRVVPARKQVRLCLSQGVRQRVLGSRFLQRSLATASKGQAVTADVTRDGDSLEIRSHAIAARIEELSLANSLDYPRIQNSDIVPIRVPTFRKKYHDVSVENPGQEEVVLRGRLQSIRRAGSKLVFLSLTGEFQHVQAVCNFRLLEPAGVTLDAFKDLARIVTRGDIISVKGTAVRTKTGELSIQATALPSLLSPSLVPLPFKLEEDDSKIQNRHIDMLVNPSTVDVLRMRSYIMRYMRDFFHDRGFLEFQTPILAENAGGAIARPFVTSATEFRSKDLALRIAPELWLKRLVVGGVEKVFEIGPAFRNEGIDLSHNPEFTMCEFYNAYASLQDLITQTEDLLSSLASYCQSQIETEAMSLPHVDAARYKGPYKQLEFIPELQSRLGFAFPDLSATTAKEELIVLLKKHDVPYPADVEAYTLPKLLDKLAGDHLEPDSAEAPIFITHHPACMSPLSKTFTCDKTNQVISARAELFVGGRELANMYEEENSPFAQRKKFVEQAMQHRDPLAGEDVVVDESYIQALESGLPPTGGWGCGVERLVMLFSGARRISDCLSFGNLRNVVGLSAGVRKTKA